MPNIHAANLKPEFRALTLDEATVVAMITQLQAETSLSELNHGDARKIGQVSLSAVFDYGNWIGFAVDHTAKKIWVRATSGTNNWNDDPPADPATGTNGADYSTIAAGALFPCFQTSGVDGGEKATANFGATAYNWTAPSGFGNL